MDNFTQILLAVAATAFLLKQFGPFPTVLLLGAFALFGCGDDSSGDDDYRPNIAQLSLSESDVSSARRRCVDNNIALLDADLLSCINRANENLGVPYYSCTENRCREYYAHHVAQLNNSWENLHAYAYQQYQNCASNTFEVQTFGAEFCKNEYARFIEWNIQSCSYDLDMCL